MNNYSRDLPKIKYGEIKDLLQHLLLQLNSILITKFVGMYIGGSIANDSFDPITSDIDCYVITSSPLSKQMRNKIEEMHQRFYLSEHPYAKKIELSYIPQNDFLNFNPNHTRPYFNEGRFIQAHYGSNFVIELFVLREKGLTLIGPNIKDLIKKISTKDLKQAIKNNIHEYWEPTLNSLSKFEKSDYQVFAVLTMCRTLYSLKTDLIASKIEAGYWVIHHHTHWKDLIEQALAWKPNIEFNRIEETLKFIKYTFLHLKT